MVGELNRYRMPDTTYQLILDCRSLALAPLVLAIKQNPSYCYSRYQRFSSSLLGQQSFLWLERGTGNP
jgi:hypothetical protein